MKLQRPNSLNRLLGRWWPSIWTQCHQKLLGETLVYGLEVLMGCQRILYPRGIQTLEGGNSQKKWRTLWRWKEVYIIRIMMTIARNSELEFQRLLEHHPFFGEDPHVKHPLIRHIWWRMMWMMKCPMEFPKF